MEQAKSKHQRSNQGQSFLIITTLAIILSITGFALSGTFGIIVALGTAGFLIMASRKASPAMLLKMYKARPIEPHELQELQQIFHSLVKRADLNVTPRLYYVPSEMLNAFAVGRGQQSVVAVTHGLLEHMTNRELAGVLAHELSHIKHKDLSVMGLADVFSRMTTTMGNVGQLMVLLSIPLVLFGKQPLLPWSVVLVLLVTPMLSGMLQLALSRSREFEADLGAAQISGDPNGLALALRKIDQAQTSWLQKMLLPGRKIPAPALLRTHPPTEDRISRLTELSGKALPAPVAMPEIEFSPPMPQQALRRPRWHIMTGLWY